MTSLTAVVITRAAGLVAYTWVTTLISPLGVAASFSQRTLICRPVEAGWLGSHVLAKSTWAGLGCLETVHMWSVPWVAPMVLFRLCGRIWFTGIESVFLLPLRLPPSNM